jgi:hypothetical protein
MNASLLLLIVMIAATALVAVYRWIVAHHEDDFLHIQDPSGELVANQEQTERALSRVDHIGIGLTVATALYAVGLVLMFLYKGLN